MSSTLPVVRNYAPYIGDTFSKSLIIKEDGSLTNLSGDTFKLRIQEKATGVEFLTLETGTGITNPSTGMIVWTISAAQSADFVNGKKYVYDLQWTRSDGVVTTLIRGEIVPTKDVTPA